MRLLRKIFGSTPEIHIEYKQNYSGSTGITKSINFDLSEAPRLWDKETTEFMCEECGYIFDTNKYEVTEVMGENEKATHCNNCNGGLAP
jgi:hypothetical protein